MARRITANFYMTLDGYGEFPPYPGSDAVPEEPSDAWKEMWSNRYDSVDTIIFGRRSYENHQTEFSLAVGKFSDGPYYMLDYCWFLERVRKIVISNSIKKTDWQNSQIMSGDLKKIVTTLKAEPGKDIILEGGPSLVHDFVRQGLVDDYRMAIWPVILGQGNHYWGSMLGQQTPKLVDVRTLTYSRLFLHYETVRQA